MVLLLVVLLSSEIFDLAEPDCRATALRLDRATACHEACRQRLQRDDLLSSLNSSEGCGSAGFSKAKGMGCLYSHKRLPGLFSAISICVCVFLRDCSGCQSCTTLCSSVCNIPRLIIAFVRDNYSRVLVVSGAGSAELFQ
jgi:hypothetical protein